MKKYIAHFNDNGLIQTVKEHLINVSKLSKEYGKKTNLSASAELIGILHDIGKYSDKFIEYINQAMEKTKAGEFDEWKRHTKTVDYGKYGAIYLYEKLDINDKLQKKIFEILLFVILNDANIFTLSWSGYLHFNQII